MKYGWVYFISDGVDVKIGRTSGRPESRMRQLQTGHPRRLRLLAVQREHAGLERDLHRRFAHARIRSDGEWFRLTPDLKRYIAGRRAPVRDGARLVVRGVWWLVRWGWRTRAVRWVLAAAVLWVLAELLL